MDVYYNTFNKHSFLKKYIKEIRIILYKYYFVIPFSDRMSSMDMFFISTYIYIPYISGFVKY